MAAPGTLTHVLEVAARVAAAAVTHAQSIQQAASAADPPVPSAAEAPPPAPAGY